jgi:predicted RNA-binding protein with PIN domain
MQTLIDGYNLMYELGLLEKRLGPDGFRKARNRFLNRLAEGLGAVASHQTTVVFDAREAPRHLPRESTYKGLTVIYADEDEGADARIERLIAAHSVPKSLTVVSTDHRIRKAASRRKARTLTADAFWQELENPPHRSPPPARLQPEEPSRLLGPSPDEAADWLETFRDLEARPETLEALGQDDVILTDEDIRRIAREVDAQEGRHDVGD